METSILIGLFEALSDTGKMEVMDFTRFITEREKERKDKNNREFLAKLARADEQVRNGQVIVKTMEELEAMAR